MDNMTQEDRIQRYAELIRRQTGKAVRPFRADGYANLVTKYGTSKDVSEHYEFVPESSVPDDVLERHYESNGLFAKIIDAPAEDALRVGFELDGISDDNVADFYAEALDELDWEETAMTAIKWARLFGGSIIVLLVNDGHGLEEPLDWKNIQSIDDIRVYDRSLIQPDYSSVYSYDYQDPFRTRGSRLGMPERYTVFSKYGTFTVHDSRCLVFQNGVLPENASDSIYQMWGVPEYVRINKALRDTDVSHRMAPKLLERSVQPIYKMKDLSAELATEEGEDRLLKRLQVIDTARGVMNSLVIDSEGEDYDFKSFSFSGVTDVIHASCNMLSAITNIPQIILFGQTVGGLSSSDDTSMENYYNYVGRIQKRMLRGNLRYLLSIIFQAGLATGEIDEIPKINIKFKSLWSLTETQQVELEQQKAAIQKTRAETAQIYVSMEAIDPSEIREKLADSDELNIETMLDDYTEEELTEHAPSNNAEEKVEGEEHPEDGTESIEGSGNAPMAAPAATKLPQDMSESETEQSTNARQPDAEGENTDEADGPKHGGKDTSKGVGILVIKDGKILCGVRNGEGTIGGPGGHIKDGENPEDAAIRETQEEFGITPIDLIQIGQDNDSGTTAIFICTDYEGEPHSVDGEMLNPKFCGLDELNAIEDWLFPPFASSFELLAGFVDKNSDNSSKHLTSDDGYAIIKSQTNNSDGGPGSGNHNHNHSNRIGFVGGSLPKPSDVGANAPCTHQCHLHTEELGSPLLFFHTHQGRQYPSLPSHVGLRGLVSSSCLQSRYVTDDGKVVRFNRKTTEYASGHPGGDITTYMLAKCRKKKDSPPEVDVVAANRYFESCKEKRR